MYYNYMIYNYNEINVLPNSLVILDIDETIFSFSQLTPTWWDDMKKTHDDAYAYLEWVKIISFNLPQMLNSIDFFILMNEITYTNSKLILLTARNVKLREITCQQLTYCKIPIDPKDIWFSDKKGLTVHNMIRQYKMKHTIFVDDRLKNVDDVKRWNPKVDCYHFQNKE